MFIIFHRCRCDAAVLSGSGFDYMKIVVAGDGKVGDTLIGYIAAEGHDVTVIDTNPMAIDNVVNRFDVMGIVGNGASYETQTEAGVGSADLFIAVTYSDELNLMSCIIAKKLGAGNTIARVRNPDYAKSTFFLSRKLGVDLIINPEDQASHEIARLLRFPAAMKIDEFSRGKAELAEIKISADHPLIGRNLVGLEKAFGVRVLICTVRRGDEVIIPRGDFVFRQGDIVGVAASQTDLSRFFDKLGLLKKRVRSVIIAGGGKTALYLAKRLVPLGMKVKLIEADEPRCNELSALLPPSVTVINGNCIDSELLVDEGLESADACIALTGSDELNVVVSMFAHSKGVGKVIAKITKISSVGMLEPAGIDSIISPRAVTSDGVLRYVRGIESGRKGSRVSGNIKTLYKICDNKAEALEFDVTPNFGYCGVALKDLKIKKNLLIASIVRNDSVLIPGGLTTIESGDSVIVVTTDEQLCDINDIMA